MREIKNYKVIFYWLVEPEKEICSTICRASNPSTAVESAKYLIARDWVDADFEDTINIAKEHLEMMSGEILITEV